jgi:hypothetical protein
MSDEGIDRAVRALRAAGDAGRRGAPGMIDLRTRALLAAAERGRSRRRLVRWALPLAATLVFSSAWAASSGYLGAPWRAVRALVGESREVPVPPAPSRVAAGEPTTPAQLLAPAPETSAPTDPSPPVVPVESLPVAPAWQPSTSRAEPSAARGTTPVADPGASTATVPSQALYAAAHRAHFVDQNPGIALAAWDAYLRAAPDGALAPEARYNRAVCLVRLGRRQEARDALRPFAVGQYGEYRRLEATELIAALAAP